MVSLNTYLIPFPSDDILQYIISGTSYVRHIRVDDLTGLAEPRHIIQHSRKPYSTNIRLISRAGPSRSSALQSSDATSHSSKAYNDTSVHIIYSILPKQLDDTCIIPDQHV